jgi:minor extracellular serine protease Vpr
VTGPGHAHPLDDGWITWRGADGTRTRIPVVLSR